MSYYGNRKNAVAYVDEKLANSKAGSVLTMIIGRDKFGDFFAHTVIDELSDVTALEADTSYLRQRMNTSQKNTQDG